MSNSSCSREFTRQLNLALSVYLTILSESSGASSVVKHDRRKSWHFRSRAHHHAQLTRGALQFRETTPIIRPSLISSRQHSRSLKQKITQSPRLLSCSPALFLHLPFFPSSLVFLFLPLSLPTATFAFVLVSASTVFYGRCELACIVSLIGQESESVGAEQKSLKSRFQTFIRIPYSKPYPHRERMILTKDQKSRPKGQTERMRKSEKEREREGGRA